MPVNQRRQKTAEERQPQYVVRAPDSNKRGRWVTVGYAWPLGNGKDGYSVKLNTVPVGAWDGALVLLPPFDPSEDDPGDSAEYDRETGEVR
jgi:hypothetical protein